MNPPKRVLKCELLILRVVHHSSVLRLELGEVDVGNTFRKSGRKVAIEAAMMPSPGSIVDQIAIMLASLNQLTVAVASRLM